MFFVGLGPLPARTVARFSPNTSRLTEWVLSGYPSEFIAITPPSKVFVADASQNAIVRLNPSVQARSQRLTKMTFPAVIPMTATTPFVRGNAAPTSQTVPSTVTVVPGTTVGAFTTLTLPTPVSNPRGICANASGLIFFTEQGTHRIGRLTA